MILKSDGIVIDNSSNLGTLFVVLPAFNVPIQVLVSLIAGLRKNLQNQSATLCVVDDGSDLNLKDSLELSDYLLCERHFKNRGKGAALKTGFRLALAQKVDLIMTLDADGQHHPNDVRNLLSVYSREGADLIIGSRMSDLSQMPFHRILSNRITSWLISLRIGQRIEDSQSGFRLIKADLLRKFELKSRYFDLETELLLKAGKCGARIAAAPIQTSYPGNIRSSITYRDVFRFLVTYVRNL